ncbi:MAG TPA: paraquat-inducible protein A, partial [Gammaproteobacteria bacterium]|nr:paraquat-inducible protein A [Gammaproteobacteria bacterium]
KVEKVRSLNQIAAYHQRRVEWSGWLLLGLSLAFLTLKSTRARRADRASLRELALHLIGVSAVFLLVGVVAPMLTVIAQTEVTLLGEVVFQYEYRSIIGTARHLASGGNLPVALPLFIFSVLVPVAKLLLSFIALSGSAKRSKRLALRSIRFIGKWSMTDVFVVAVLLAFLSTESKAFTDASLGPGLYFFAGYGLLSLIGGQVLIKVEGGEVRAGPGEIRDSYVK